MHLAIRGNLFSRILFPFEIKDFIKSLYAWCGLLIVSWVDLFGFLVLMKSSSCSTELLRVLASEAPIFWSF